MSTRRRISCIAIGCLIAGAFAGAVGAQVVNGALPVRRAYSGLFTLEPHNRAEFHVTLHDTRSTGPAKALIQFLNRAGATEAWTEVLLQPGQTASLPIPGPAAVRAFAEIKDTTFLATPQRTVVGTVEVVDTLTGVRGTVCPTAATNIDQGGSQQGGRQ
jgi:hypothetical protein